MEGLAEGRMMTWEGLGSRSVTHSSVCGLGLLGRSLLCLVSGPTSITDRDKLGWCWPGEGPEEWNPGRGTFLLAGGSLTCSA